MSTSVFREGGVPADRCKHAHLNGKQTPPGLLTFSVFAQVLIKSMSLPTLPLSMS